MSKSWCRVGADSYSVSLLRDDKAQAVRKKLAWTRAEPERTQALMLLI